LLRPRPRVLYVSYDGALEPLGESQVVAYLERLTDSAQLTLLSFEKPADLADRRRLDTMRRRLETAGIEWIVRRYRKRPPVLSTVLDLISGCAAAQRWARRYGPDETTIVHVRGYVPALIGSYVKRMSRARLLFDMRGFWIDEKVEAGHWPAGGWLYRVGKRCERGLLARADAIVSLTAAGVRELPALGRTTPGIPIVVIPTCADLDRFVPRSPADAEDQSRRRHFGLDDALVVGCVGTLSNWYLRDDTLSYLAWLCRRIDRAKILMITRDDHAQLRTDARRAGIPDDRLILTQAAFDEMPQLMRLIDVGVFFIRVCFSKKASAATKLAEFLGCGVPVIINDGIGDSGEIIRRAAAGLVLEDTSRAAFESAGPALDRLLGDPTMATRCRALAAEQFSLDRGVAQYADLYQRLTDGPGAR
jgi:glycosyltransferase involved in cell wall biosynthesis